MSDSVRPHRQQPTRLLCPWDSPGKNTGVGCHFLLPLRFPALEVPIGSKPEEVSRGNQNPVCFSLVNTSAAPQRCLPTPCGRFIFQNRRRRGWLISPPQPRRDVRLGCNTLTRENLSSGDEAALRSYPPFFPAHGFLSAILFSLCHFCFFLLDDCGFFSHMK